MASLTGQLVAETYKALLKLIDNDILTASEKQITDGFGGGSNVFIDSQGFLRANKYKITNGLATQFLKADGSLDSNAYLTSITGAQVITALGYTPVPTTRTITINGETHNLAADNSWTVGGTAAIWGNITGTLSNQTDLQNALNAKYNNPTGTISQYIRGDGTLATFPTMPGGLPTGGSAGQILAKIDATDYNTQWIDNYATQTKNEVKLGQTLTKGTPVYVSSANGTNMIVSRASNTSEALSSKTFGLLESGGATNDIVKCVTFGLIAGLDTSTAQAGDPVWLGVNGALIFGLANKPYAPAHLVYIGVVTRVQQNNGEIFVNIQNGFELKEIHDVYIADPANNHGLFYDIADGLWKNKSIASALGYTPQAQLSGTGFVKASGTTITYDNSTYLTTTDAASTYQRLDKMVSNLLPSATEYPNSNAVIAALALKADAANPIFTGNMTISGAEPKLYFTDTDQNPDYFIGVDAGFFRVYDQTAGATRFVINSDGNISTGVGKSITAGSFIKDGGTATQFLKADGSVDSTDYATVASLANYLLSATAASTYQTLANLSTDLTTSATKYPSVNAVNAGLATKQPLDADLTAIAGLTGTSGFLKKTAADTWTLDTSTYLTTGDASTTYLAITTAASTYQRLDKMVSNLLPSSTEYPNSNAVINALALKADAANPVFTGNMTISGATPRLYFVDTDQNPDYTVFIDSGFFYIYDQTAGATRFSINSSGNINTGVGKSITAGSFVKESGTASQFLKADGSIDSNTYLTSSSLSGYVSGSGTTNKIVKWNGTTTVVDSYITDAAGTATVINKDGTSITAALLSIYPSTGTNASILNLDNSGAGSFYIGRAGSTGGNPLISVSAYDSVIGHTGSQTLNFVTNSIVRFFLNGSGAAVFNTSIGFANGTITSSGEISLGASSPNIYTYGRYAGVNGGRIIFNNGTGANMFFGEIATHIYGFTQGAINSPSILTFNLSALNLGIGTSNPTDKLHLYNSTASTILRLTIENTANGYNSDIAFKSTYGGTSTKSFLIGSNINVGSGSWEIYDATNPATRFVISSTGNVGIGVNAANTNGSKLFVAGNYLSMFDSSAVRGISIFASQGASYHAIYSDYTGGGSFFPISISARQNASDLYIATSGNIAIGTTTDAGYKLDVNGTGRFITTSTVPLTVETTSGNSGVIIKTSSSTYNWLLGAQYNIGNGFEITASTAVGGTTFSTPLLKILNTGAATFSSSVTAGGTISSSNGAGSGITLANGSIYSSQANSEDDILVNIVGYNGGTTQFRNFRVYDGKGNIMFRTFAASNRIGIGINSILNSSPYISVYSPIEKAAQFITAGDGTIVIGGSAADGASSGEQYITYQNGTTNTNAWMVGMDDGEDWRFAYGAVGEITDANTLMRLTQSGNFMIGTITDNGYKLQVNGSMSATAYYESSDLKLKNISKKYDSNNFGAIEFGWIDGRDKRNHWGYIAQEVQKWLPDAVNLGKDGFLSVDYNQAHTFKIAKVEDEVTKLKKRVAELEKQLNIV